MARIKVQDQANLFRIEIEGGFSGETVAQVRAAWHTALANQSSRQFTVDISQLTGYDLAGSQLLREMQEHGTCLSARTPRALVFLSEISTPKPLGPTLVYQAAPAPPQPPGNARLSRPTAKRAIAGGE